VVGGITDRAWRSARHTRKVAKKKAHEVREALPV
jgi:hypothetical protein